MVHRFIVKLKTSENHPMDNNRLNPIAQKLPLVALDVGARGGGKHDLDLLSSFIHYYCFEPDKEEADRLDKILDSGNWMAATCMREALGAHNSHFNLNLYSKRGCSSGLRAEKKLGSLFSRGDYYNLDDVVTVPERKLDDLVSEGKVAAPSYIKIDVQGMELQVFEGAELSLKNHVVGVRTEVCFFPFYKNQPLFSDIDEKLRSYGFYPMQWLEFHEWRRKTRKKYPIKSGSEIPVSRGQMMHGDILYLLHPEFMSSESDKDKERLVHLALVSLCYENYDHAIAALSKVGVREFVADNCGLDPLLAIQELSNTFEKRTRYARFASLFERYVLRFFNQKIPLRL